MRLERLIVPGASWVESVSIREKDGSPPAADNWRRKLFDLVS